MIFQIIPSKKNQSPQLFPPIPLSLPILAPPVLSLNPQHNSRQQLSRHLQILHPRPHYHRTHLLQPLQHLLQKPSLKVVRLRMRNVLQSKVHVSQVLTSQVKSVVIQQWMRRLELPVVSQRSSRASTDDHWGKIVFVSEWNWVIALNWWFVWIPWVTFLYRSLLI